MQEKKKNSWLFSNRAKRAVISRKILFLLIDLESLIIRSTKKKTPNKKEPTIPTKRKFQLLLLRHTIKPENLIKPTVNVLNE